MVQGVLGNTGTFIPDGQLDTISTVANLDVDGGLRGRMDPGVGKQAGHDLVERLCLTKAGKHQEVFYQTAYSSALRLDTRPGVVFRLRRLESALSSKFGISRDRR